MNTFLSYQAVIFDLDGVLAYTEPAIFRILKKLVASFGVTITSKDEGALFGLDYPDSMRYLKAHYDIPVETDRLVEMLVEAVLERIEGELEPAPGGLDLVENLALRGMAIGVASNSPREYVRRVVHGLGLSGHFPAPVGREDVVKGKPYPDPYLEACRRAGADPAHSLAIEDSPVGAQAALAAGMACALIGPKLPPGLENSISIYPSLSALGSALLAR